MTDIPVRWKLIVCMGLLLSGILYAFGGRVFAAGSREEGERSEGQLHEIYEEDDRFRLVSQETFAYDKEQPIRPDSLGSQYLWVNQSYEAEEIAKSCHATFDGQNRLLYALGYTANILGDSSSYCEERIYERDDAGHARRYLYYKSNSIPYEDGYYIGFRYLFEDSEFQYDEEGRLLRCLTYRRNVGSDPNGYSEELFFDRGYQAEYEDGRLTGPWRERFSMEREWNCLCRACGCICRRRGMHRIQEWEIKEDAGIALPAQGDVLLLIPLKGLCKL